MIYCPKCGEYFDTSGHVCKTEFKQSEKIYFNPNYEIIQRLDKIIELLERLSNA